MAWDKEVARRNPWTIPVAPDVIARAREGEWSILLTPTKPVPRSWFPQLAGVRVLCLASGGGQQGPVLAAAGANVTVLDNSPRQLAQDEFVAARDGLGIATVLGDMADLSMFSDSSFDLIVHPCSNSFIPNLKPVWSEAYRVLRPNCSLLSGFSNGIIYLFDEEAMDQGILEIAHSLPYSDLEGLGEQKLEQRVADGMPLEFGHTLTDQIGGQLEAGFLLDEFYEDSMPGEPLAERISTYIATKAVKTSRERRD